MTYDNDKIKQQIISIMEEQGTTYEYVAKQLGYSRQFVWRLLHDKSNLRISTIRKLLQTLGYDVDVEIKKGEKNNDKVLQHAETGHAGQLSQTEGKSSS